MDRNFVVFRAVFDDLTDEVERARYQFFPDHLRNWFEQIDETPGVNAIIQRLEAGLDFPTWLKEQEKSVSSMAGSGKLRFPEDKEKELGMKLLLFREFANGRAQAFQFAHRFVYTKGDMNALTGEVVSQLFSPMARSLRRLLEREFTEREDGTVPASDRVVKLDHNSQAYKDAIRALETLERVIRQSNEYDDPAAKEQHAAEVKAGKTLLEGLQVRASALWDLIRNPTAYVAKKFGDSMIGKAAAAAWEAVSKLIF